MPFESLKGWTPGQRHAVTASYFAWSLDAFDFFILTFVLSQLATQFSVTIADVAVALTLTLAFRPVGAFLFGRMADHYGRKPVLMLNIGLYSLFGFLTAFAPSLPVFFVIRAVFGMAMGGIWGIGASLAFESIKSQARGFVSGLMQSGYPTGYLFASLAFGLLFAPIGWRGLFMIGAAPAALLILYIWRMVPESPGWHRQDAKAVGTLTVLRQNWRLALYAILLMTAFNFFSHGTQDLYPTFLQKQHGFGSGTVSSIAVIYNIGAILGGLTFGALSQRWGRRRTVIITALLAIPVAGLWAFSTTAVMLAAGAFLMQVFVQGAWGVVPAHLNELSPKGVRGTFPGTVYQLGNFIASINAVLQARIAEMTGGNFALALFSVAACAGLVIAAAMALGPEAQNAELT